MKRKTIDNCDKRLLPARIDLPVYGRILLGILLIWVLSPLSARCGEKALHIDDKGHVGVGTLKPTAKLDVNGDIKGIGMAPPGAIVMFYGDINTAFDNTGKGINQTPYEGWQLCNGTNGAPDLRDKFVAGAGGAYPVGSTGGADTIALTEAQLPAHHHGGNTAAAGDHRHDIRRNNGILRYTWKNGESTTTVKAGAGGEHFKKAAGLSTGSGGRHTHPIPNAGGNQSHENRPPFIALAFIMRLPVAPVP